MSPEQVGLTKNKTQVQTFLQKLPPVMEQVAAVQKR
jgi:hypothetical protein